MTENSVPSSKYIEEVNNGVFSESWSSTQIKVYKVRHTWTINNFSFSDKKAGEELDSSTFLVGINSERSEWFLKLYPKGCSKDTSSFVSLYLFIKPIESGNDDEILAKCKLAIVNSKDQLVNIRTFSNRFITDGFGYPEFVKEEFLFNDANEVLPNDKLTIFCEIVATVGTENISETLTAPLSNPAMGFKFILKTAELSDVTLTTCAGGKDFPAHKVILANRSPVFRAMFQNDMKESRTSRVEISDVDEEGLTEMLRYVYTGKIKKMVPSLLSMAEKYTMTDLKVKCEEELFKSLSLENVAEMFILSDTFRAEKLKNQVKEFIVAHAAVVGKTPEFQSMIRTYPHLAIEAFCALSYQCII